MPDALVILLALCGAILLAAGAGAQVRTHRLRRRWSQAGAGLEERATGLASIAAIPILFPSELDAARATGTKLAVLAVRRYTEHPERFGRRLAHATRAHETAWRIDYDVFAVTVAVDDHDDAVLAASRIGRAACGDEAHRDLRIGIAICPDDATEMFDALEVATRRMRGFSIVDAVAARLRHLDEGPRLVTRVG